MTTYEVKIPIRPSIEKRVHPYAPPTPRWQQSPTSLIHWPWKSKQHPLSIQYTAFTPKPPASKSIGSKRVICRKRDSRIVVLPLPRCPLLGTCVSGYAGGSGLVRSGAPPDATWVCWAENPEMHNSTRPPPPPPSPQVFACEDVCEDK